MSRGSVLIAGAGIAGPTVAYWLRRYGWDVTVVERADAPRTTGQNIDVRGAGRRVCALMGVEDGVAAAGTGEVGTRFVDGRGRSIAEFPTGAGDGPTAELEIIRGQLVSLLLAHTKDVEYLYGRRIEAVEQDTDAVTVHIGGTRRRFDLLVVAEGIRSRTRGLVFEDVPRVRDLGQYAAYGTIPRVAGDDAWWRWYSPGGGRAVMLRPDNVGTTRGSLYWLGPPKGYEYRTPAEQIAVLRAEFAGVGWQTRRILDALAVDHDDFYLERVSQVYAPSWSRGRVVMVGDAAYCASPISGMGTSLALTGAYVLATALAEDPYRVAFQRYEDRMRPYVARAQKLAPGAPRIVNPRSQVGVRVLRAGLRLADTRAAKKVFDRVFVPPADEFRLPAPSTPSG
jgi:2-polyprenyl-6-methoxyphenol hydroxylase-like FAD-dependent oxidoreductase